MLREDKFDLSRPEVEDRGDDAFAVGLWGAEKDLVVRGIACKGDEVCEGEVTLGEGGEYFTALGVHG